MNVINKLKKTIFFVLLVIYEEIIFSIFAFKQFPTTIILIILFSIPIGIIFNLLTSCLKERANKIITYIVTIVFCILFCAHFIYNQIYKSIISIYSFSNGKQVFQFYETILETIKNNFLAILLLILPVIVLIILHKFKKMDFYKSNLERKLFELIAFFTIQIIAIISVNFGETDTIYSNKNLYYNSNSLIMIAKRFGVCTTMRLDLKRMLIKDNDNETIAVINKIVDQPIEALNEDKEYNFTQIDFEALAANEQNSAISSIHKYMAVQTPSEKNDYTGIFEGKNLIVIVGESFSNIGIRKDFTPTLYKLSNDGFKFNNFYTPLYPVSTADRRIYGR